MSLLLKDLLKEVEDEAPLKVQIYMDLDGVLADLDKAFKKISGGYTPNNFKEAPEFHGEEKLARKKFWKLVNSTPNFWESLEMMPDAKVLWNFVARKFVDPKPVVLTAGQGNQILTAKTNWVNKHLGPEITTLVSVSGSKKPEYIIQKDGIQNILIDDTRKNIDAWNNSGPNNLAILHKNAAESIRLLNELTK